MSEADVHELLAQSPLFTGLSQAALDEVLQASKLRMISAKTVIFHQGDTSKELFAVGKGIVKMWQMRNGGASATIHILGPGELVGAVAAFRQAPFLATATAVTDCILLSWAVTRTQDLMKRHPAIGANALEYVSRHSEELAQRLGEMVTERVEQRIARALLRLAEQIGRGTAEGIEIGYPLSRQDIAEIVGTDLYVVSRVLHDWAARGLIVTGRLRVVLRDQAQIEQIATDGR